MKFHSKKRENLDSLMTPDENRAMFDFIAPYYDGANRILSLGLDRVWRREAVSKLSPKSGAVYLDVGCGSGDIGLEIIRYESNCRVVGVDFSDGMLSMGWKKLRRFGLESKILLKHGDCLSLDFPDNSFDGVITVFCIRNTPDHRQALSEMVRVLKPGSKLVIMELTEPQGLLMKPLFGVYSRTVMPLITKLMSSVSAYKYLSDSMAAFPKPDEFIGMMVESGMTEAQYKPITGGIVTVFEGNKDNGRKRPSFYSP